MSKGNTVSLLNFYSILFTVMRIKIQAIIFGWAPAKFRSREVPRFHILCGVNSSSMHLIELF